MSMSFFHYLVTKNPQKTTETQIFYFFYLFIFFSSAFTYYPKAVGLWFYLSHIHGPLMVVASKKYLGLKSGNYNDKDSFPAVLQV